MSFYRYYDKNAMVQKMKRWDDDEMAIVDSVRCLGADNGTEPYTKACITLRIPVSLKGQELTGEL